MIIGEININDDEDKRKPITETIGFNPSRRNIIKNQNFNMNIMTEKTREDVDKLTYHYLELSEAPLEEKTHDINSITTKYSKMKEMYTTNNFYNSLLCPEEPCEINAPKKNIAYDGGTFLTDKISLSSHQFKKTGEIEKEKEKERNGKGKEYYYYYYNRIIVFEGEYLNGERHGFGKEYYDSGKLKFEGE